MFVADGLGGSGEPAPPEAREMVLLWSLRCLVATMASGGANAREPKVEAALLRQFGEAGQEMAVLLRCLAQMLPAAAGPGRAPASPCPMPSCAARGCLGAASLGPGERLLLSALRSPRQVSLAPLFGPEAATAATQLTSLIAMLMRRSC